MSSHLEPLTAHELSELSQIDGRRWLTACLADWCCVAWAALAAILSNGWWLWPIAILVIGNRQHALAVLMHEGTHRRISRNRRWNALLSDLLAGYPVLMPTANYRIFHLDHHRWLDTPRDPEGIFCRAFPDDTRFPQSWRRFVLLLVRDLSGLWPRPLWVLSRLIYRLPGQRLAHLLPIALLHGTVAVAAHSAGILHAYLLLWVLPLATVFPATFRIRSLTEHHGIEEAGDERYQRTEPDVWRTTRSVRGRLGELLIAPHNINYHLEHHLYPSVPFHRLPQLAALLGNRTPQHRARVRRSYWEALRECLRRLGAADLSGAPVGAGSSADARPESAADR